MIEAWFSSSDRTASSGVSKAWRKPVGIEPLSNHFGPHDSKFHCQPGHSSKQGDKEPSVSIWVPRAPGLG